MLVVITPFASTPAGARLRVLYINNDDSIVVEGNIVVDPDYVLPLVPPKHRLLMDCATPVQGWDAFLRDAGVSLKLYGNTGAQFFAEFWGGVGSGKTGGLHMSEVGTCMRRCQLSVEHGVEGQSLRHSVAGTKAGLLIYVGNVTTEVETPGPTSMETSARMSFTALLLVYVEMVSLVRRRVYAQVGHPRGGVEYRCRAWDNNHPRPTTVIRVHGKKQSRGIDVATLATARAEAWVRLEQFLAPQEWGLEVVSLLENSTTSVWVAGRHESATRCAVRNKDECFLFHM